MAPTQEHSDSEQNASMGVSGVVIGLAVVSVALRFYTRIFTKAGLKSDDWFIMAAVIATLVTAALLLWGTDRWESSFKQRY
jgi:Ca2+/H+ antiporter